MNRTNRIALLLAGVLVVVVAGTALANRTPTAETPSNVQADDPEPPDAEALQHAADRLTERGIDPAALEGLAATHGLGGAVRILAWADTGVATVDQLVERRAAGEGWGQIAKDLNLHPGLGSIMGNGGGHGRDTAPGQQRDDGSGD